MSSKRAFIVACWIAGAALAFLLGKVTRPDHPAAEPATGGADLTSAPIGPSMSPRQALRLPSAWSASRAFAEAVLTLKSSEEFQSAFGELRPGFEDARTHDALFVLADAWGAVAPEEACAWLDQLEFNDVRNPYLFSALTQWAGADPDAAGAWIEANHADPGPGRDYLLAALVRGMAGRDPESALQLLLASPSSPERTGSIDFLVRTWSSAGRENAFQRVAALPASEQRLKERAIRQLVDGLTDNDLESAATWAASLASVADRRSAQAAIAAAWSRHDPEGAVEWAGSLKDVAARSRAYGEIATRWARSEPLAAGRWLEQHNGRSDHDLAARAVAWSTVGIDPGTAFEQVAGITAGALRDETFEQLGRLWLSEQPQLARKFLVGENPIPPEIRERLLDSFE